MVSIILLLLFNKLQFNAFLSPFIGPVRMVQAVFPHMASKKKGKIVNVGSASAYLPAPWNGVYVANKCALHSLTDTLRFVYHN